MEENMNLDRGLQYDFIDFMGVGAQHDDDEISPAAEHELGPEQENMIMNHGSDEPGPEQENVNLNRGSQYIFIDFMGVGAQHDDDLEEFDPESKIINLNRGSPYVFIDFMDVGAQHGDDIDIDDPIPQKPDPEQVHHHQRDSTCSDVNDARLENRVYTSLQLLPTGKVERDRPEDRKVPLDLSMRLLPESSMRRLRQEGPESVTLQLGPASDPTSGPA